MRTYICIQNIPGPHILLPFVFSVLFIHDSRSELAGQLCRSVKIEIMQFDHVQISEGKKGQEVAVKVDNKVGSGTLVYKA